MNLIIIGASGHGKVVADIAKNFYKEIFFLDDDEYKEFCGEWPVIGKTSDFVKYDTDFFVAVGDTEKRKEFIEEINEARLTTLIHPNAIIAEDVLIRKGTVVMAGGIVNPGSVIGNGCIVNTGATVDHDCTIGDYVHVAVGAHICGNSRIGDETWIGAGATIIQGVDICGDCVIGAGAVVTRDIENAGKYVGVPARKI